MPTNIFDIPRENLEQFTRGKVIKASALNAVVDSVDRLNRYMKPPQQVIRRRTSPAIGGAIFTQLESRTINDTPNEDVILTGRGIGSLVLPDAAIAPGVQLQILASGRYRAPHTSGSGDPFILRPVLSLSVFLGDVLLWFHDNVNPVRTQIAGSMGIFHLDVRTTLQEDGRQDTWGTFGSAGYVDLQTGVISNESAYPRSGTGLPVIIGGPLRLVGRYARGRQDNGTHHLTVNTLNVLAFKPAE